MGNYYFLYFLPIIILLLAANIYKFKNLKLDEKYCNQVAVGSHFISIVFYAFLLYFLKVEDQPFRPFVFKTSFFVGIYLLNTVFLSLFFSVKKNYNLVTYVGLSIIIFSSIESYFFKLIILMLSLNLICRNYFNLILSNVVLFLFVGISENEIVANISVLVLFINSLLSIRKSTSLFPVIHFLLSLIVLIEFFELDNIYLSFYFSLLSVGSFFILLFNEQFKALVPQFYFLRPDKFVNLRVEENNIKPNFWKRNIASRTNASFSLIRFDYVYLAIILVFTFCFLVNYE